MRSSLQVHHGRDTPIHRRPPRDRSNRTGMRIPGRILHLSVQRPTAAAPPQPFRTDTRTDEIGPPMEIPSGNPRKPPLYTKSKKAACRSSNARSCRNSPRTGSQPAKKQAPTTSERRAKEIPHRRFRIDTGLAPLLNTPLPESCMLKIVGAPLASPGTSPPKTPGHTLPPHTRRKFVRKNHAKTSTNAQVCN